MLHFGITYGQGDRMNFMAYGLNGETYARANVCPPCRSVGFSLLGDILVCDSCGTRFNANTGDGISGACKDYPKAEVAYTISDGKLAMQYNDLVTAYADTGKPGWP
jgi:nitrite reductase/ring-hydroxylating ferredoxin subunit